jgi:transposase-like protein
MAKDRMNLQRWLRNLIDDGDGDMLQELVEQVLNAMMSADVDAQCGAEHGERSEARVNRRNGYRKRGLKTRIGELSLAIPKVREGSYYPSWLLEARRPWERAFVSVVVQAYVSGVSTRRVDGLVKAMGLEGISKSTVSEMAKELDEVVKAFRARPLNAGPYKYVWVDALTMKCREAKRVCNVAVVVATAVNVDGRREILGLDVVTTESGAGWTSFLRDLVARGLSGVELVVSDAHVGLKQAIEAVLPGAAWQRCRTHFMRNLLTRVPKRAQSTVASMVRTIFAQPDEQETREQHERVVAHLRKSYPDAAQMLEEAAEEILAFASFPKPHWKQIWSNNPQERLNREIRRRTDVVGIFPNRDAIIRLVGALLSEQNDEWHVSRRYMSLESLAAPEQAPSAPNTPTVAALEEKDAA